jgi:S-disulfanyl-L-cysteine oxidoreductase SoxD
MKLLPLSTAGALMITLAWTTSAYQSQKTVWDGVYTEEQAKRGEALYKKFCAECHADGLTGVEQAPALTGVAFASNWDTTPLVELFDRMRTSMPENNPGSLSRQQNADILAHVLHVNQFPTGAAALPTDDLSLRQIRYEATKKSR